MRAVPRHTPALSQLIQAVLELPHNSSAAAFPPVADVHPSTFRRTLGIAIAPPPSAALNEYDWGKCGPLLTRLFLGHDVIFQLFSFFLTVIGPTFYVSILVA